MKKAVLMILIIYFFQGLIHNLGHPVTPDFVSDLGIDDYMFGVFFATMSFGLVIGGPIWGVLGDIGNKRFYIVAGLLVYSFGQIMFGYATNEYLMVLYRFISGFGVASSVTLLLSHLICLSPKEERTKYIAFSVALFTLGAGTGYYIGGFISENEFFINLLGTDDLRRIFLLQAVLNIFHALNVFIQVKEVPKPQNGEEKASVIQGFKDIRKMNVNLVIFLSSLTFISIGMINIGKFLDVYFIDLGYTKSELGQFVFVTGIVSVLTSIFIVPLVVKMKRQLTIMIWIQLFSSVIIFFVFRNDEFILLLYTVFMVYILLRAVYAPLEQNYISTHAKDGKYGTIMGVRQSFFAVGMVIGPLIGGFLYYLKPLYVFDFSVLMFIIGFILLLIMKNRIKRELE